MAVLDDFGRVTKLTEDLKSLSESLKASVGKAVEYAADKAKDSTDKMKEEFDRLVEAMEDLGDDVKENLKSTKGFVEEVKRAAESVEKIKAQRASSGRDTLADAQREQTRILQQILASQRKALSDKAAKFTSGATVLSAPAPKKTELKEMGFRPRGADKIPAMVSPNEFIVSKKGTAGNESLLNRINRGYLRGGKVKPAYLAKGTLAEGTGGKYGRDFTIKSIDKVVEIIVKGEADPDLIRQIKSDFAHLGEEVSVKFVKDFDNQLKKSAARWFASMATAFTGGGDPWQNLFEGAVKDVTEFRREMRNLAFQTEGITGNFREAQAEFAKIGENIAGRTGVNVTAFQKAYMNNARKGFKDQKAGMRVLESGLKLSTLIGSESQATASLFADWHRELGLGAAQMERMANNMQMVARNTGVTGDELVAVMKSSEQVLKNLRNQGTLTTTAARNVTQAMAEFKKQGFEEAGQSMLSAMSGFSAFNAADKGTKTFLQIAADRGGVDQLELMHGQVLQDPEKMGKMGTGLRDFLAQNAGFKPEDYDKFDMDLLSEPQRRQLSIVLDSMGKSLGDADAAMKVVGKSAKGLGGELSELDKASKSVTSTQEQRKEAEKKMNDRLLSASMDQLGGLMGAAEKFSDKDLGGLADELKKDTKFGREFEGGAKEMAAMIPYLSDSIKSQFGLSGTAEQMSQQMSKMGTGDQINLRSLAAAEQLDKALAEQGKAPQDFSKRMQAALAKGDTVGFKTIAGEMTAAYQESQVADAAGVDPMEKLEQTMNKLNGTIRSYLSPLTGGIIDLIGAMGLLGIQVGLMGSTIFNLVGGDFLKYLAPGNLRSSIDDLALSFATSEKAKDGILKKFATTYAESRTGAGKGVTKSLNDAFGSVRDDMLKGMSKMRGATVDFFQNAGKTSTRFFNTFVAGFKRGWRSSGNLFEAMSKGFGYAMKSSDATRGILLRMSGAMTNLNGRYIQTLGSLRKTSPALANFLHKSVMLGKSFGTLKFGEIIPRFGAAMKSGFSVFKNFFNPRSWTTLFSTGLKGMKGAILGGSLGTAQIIFSAIDMVFGAVSGFMNTGKRFEGVLKAMGKSTKDLTWGMYASSTITGALVGILDGLTFGLLRMSGAAEFLEQTLSFVLYTVFSFVEGIVEGILYPFRMVWSAIKYIGTQFKSIGDSILGVFNAIAGIFGAEAGNWSEAFAMVYPWLKAIGRVIGYVVGMPLAGFLWLLVKGISAALVPIQMLINAVAGVIRVIAGFVKFFVDIFRVGLWQATKNLVGTIFSAIYGVFKPVVDFIWSLVSDITAPFRWLYDILVGHSIVPDLVTGIVSWFAKLPFKIFGFLVKIPVMLGRALLKIPSLIGDMYSKVGAYFQSFGNDNVFSMILSQLGNLYSFIGGTIKNLVGIASGVLSVIQGIFTLDFGMIWEGVSQVGSSIVNQLSNIGDFFYRTLKNVGFFLFKMLKRIPMMLIRGMKAVFFEFPSWLVGKLMDGMWAVGNFLFIALPKMMWDGFKKTMSYLGKFIWDTLTWPFRKIGELLKAVFYDFPIWLGNKLMEGLQAVFYDLPMWLGSAIASGFQAIFYDLPVWLGKTIWDGMGKIVSGIPGAIYGALHAAASAIGMGWLVDRLAGGGKKAGSSSKTEATTASAAAPGVVGGLATVAAGLYAFKKAGPAVLGLAGKAFEGIKGAGPQVVSMASKAFGYIKNIAPNIGEYAGDAFGLLKGLIPSRLSKAAGGLFGKVGGALSKAQSNPFATMGGTMGKQANKTRGIMGMISDSLGGAMKKGKELAGKAGSALTPKPMNPFATMGGTMGKQANKTRGIMGMISDSLGGAMKKGRGFLTSVTGKGGAMKVPSFFDKGKGIIGSLFGKSGGVVSAGKGLVSRGSGMVGSLFGKSGGVVSAGKGLVSRGAGIVGSLFGKSAGIGAKVVSAVSAGGGVMGSLFGKAGGLLAKVGMGGVGKSLLKKLPGIGAVAGAGFAIASLVQGDIGGALTNLASGLAGSIPLIGPVLSAGIDMFGGAISEGAGWIANKAWEGAKNIGSKALEGAKWLGSKAWEGVSWLGSKVWEGAQAAGSWFASWFEGNGDKENKENKENKLATLAMAKIEAQTVVLSTAVGQHAIPAVRPGEGTPAANVEPVHLRDITGTILRDRAGSGGNKMQSDELSRMEEASYRQVSELEQIRQGIQELVSLMKPKGGIVGNSDSTGPGSTKDPRRPMHAARFGKMKFGGAGGMANRSVVNNGEV